ncbi:MAG: dihydroorotate dehydrogenase [Clostridiales bacterium]|nr:dihydroorotate dehydrogenase [Clostridiales bacterium]
MEGLSVRLGDITLDNPIIPASGTFGYGFEFAELYDLNILGSIALKGTTREPRFGNETPRIAETPSGMLNSVGLQNPGIDHVLEHEIPELKKIYHKPLILNVGGFSEEDFAYVCAAASREPAVGIIELNISCPNLHSGGANFGTSPDEAYAAVKAARGATDKPIFAKLSPNVTDIKSIAAAAVEAGADGISLINTLLGMRIDIKKRTPVLKNRTGGLSGPAVLPVALRAVYEVYDAVSVPIIGMGGISCAEDVIEMMLAGAVAVEVGAANLVNPFICRDIIEKLPETMKKYGISNLSDITGGAH